jgi:serine/threonine protein kinase
VKDTLKYSQQLIQALISIHSKGIIHCDIKPNNLMKKPDSGNLCLIDFGLAITYVPDTYLSKTGTKGYIAPELLQNDKIKYSQENYLQAFKIDIYSSGVTLLRFLLPHLFSLTFNHQVINLQLVHIIDLWKTHSSKAIKKTIKLLNSLIFDSLSKTDASCFQLPSNLHKFATLVLSMLNENPFERPSAQQILTQLSLLIGDSQLTTLPKKHHKSISFSSTPLKDITNIKI